MLAGQGGFWVNRPVSAHGEALTVHRGGLGHLGARDHLEKSQRPPDAGFFYA